MYDGIGRLTDLTHVHDTTTIADYDWTFDAFSRVTSMSFTSHVANDGDADYTYDDTNQLTGADHDFQTDESYTYDENGNRTISGYTTGDNNLLSTDGTYNYSYDDEGTRALKTNTSTGDYVEYAWDHRNRLVKITQRDDQDAITHEVIYTYDVFNRRIAKDIDADGAGGGGVETIQYVYDDDDIILAFDGSDALTNRYLHGPMVDQILADEDALGDVLWPLADNLGSVRDLVDSDGDVVNHITYDAYGNITSDTAPSVEHIYAYTGRERDAESDLQYNRARYYDAPIGQWTSEDPILFAAGDSNPRRYVANAPTNFVDPTGLAGWSHVRIRNWGFDVVDVQLEFTDIGGGRRPPINLDGTAVDFSEFDSSQWQNKTGQLAKDQLFEFLNENCMGKVGDKLGGATEGIKTFKKVSLTKVTFKVAFSSIPYELWKGSTHSTGVYRDKVWITLGTVDLP